MLRPSALTAPVSDNLKQRLLKVLATTSALHLSLDRQKQRLKTETEMMKQKPHLLCDSLKFSFIYTAPAHNKNPISQPKKLNN